MGAHRESAALAPANRAQVTGMVFFNVVLEALNTFGVAKEGVATLKMKKEMK